MPGTINGDVAYGQTTIPVGICSRFVDNNNGITMHILEAGFEEPGRPLVLLLHGYPELAYSWRKVMVPLAEAGYHVAAPISAATGAAAARTSPWTTASGRGGRWSACATPSGWSMRSGIAAWR